MRYLLHTAGVMVLFLGTNSCKKNKKDNDPGTCEYYATDSSYFYFKSYSAGGTKYIGLPGNYYPINAHIQGKIDFKVQGNYLFKSTNCLLNSAACNINDISGLKVGANTLKAELVDCKGLSSTGFFNCLSPPTVSKTETTIYGLDTVQLWIKKIKLTQQFPKVMDEGGGYPDVYMVAENFNYKSGAHVDYNAAADGSIEWALNDTFTITTSLFNMNIHFYDTDWPLQDDFLETWAIKAADANNWETGTYTFTKTGTLVIEVERLK